MDWAKENFKFTPIINQEEKDRKDDKERVNLIKRIFLNIKVI